MNIENIYKKIGVRNLNDFVSPKVIEASTWKFPKNSIVLSFLDGEFPKSDFEFLKNVSTRPRLYNAEIYSDAEYPARLKVKDIKNLVLKHKKFDNGFEYITNKSKVIFTNEKTLVLYNYGLLDKIYHYKPNKGEDYKRTLNKLKSIGTDLRKGLVADRTRFIHIPVTLPIPELKLFIQQLKKNIKHNEDVFNTDFKRTIFELFKLLYVGPDNAFLGRAIRVNEFHDIYFIFTYGHKMTVMSMLYLISACKWSQEISHIQKRDGKIIAKLFLLHIIMLIRSEVTDTVLESGYKKEGIKVLEKTDTGDFKLTDKDIEDILDSEISNTIEHLEDTNELLDGVIEKHLDPKHQKIVENLNEEKDEDIAERAMDDFLDIGVINEKKIEQHIKELKESKFKPVPVNERELEITKEEKTLRKRITVDDDSMLEDTLTPFTKKYIKNIYKKDMSNILYGIQNVGILIKNHEVEVKDTVMGRYEHHILETKLPNGKSKKIKMIIPTIREDGTFVHNTKEYVLRKQKADLPIRKIDTNKVALSSYTSKLFVTKARTKTSDRGYKIYSQLKKRASEQNSNIRLLIYKENKVFGKELPIDYGLFTRYILSFKFKDMFFYFNYEKRKSILPKDLDLKTIEKGGYILVGIVKKKPIVIDKDNNLFIKDKTLEPLGTLYSLLELDYAKLIHEYSVVKIRGMELPVGLILSYLLTFNGLLNILNVKYERETYNKKFEPMVEDHYIIKFNDYKYRIKANQNRKADMILSGLVSIKELSKISHLSLDIKNDTENFLFMLGANKTIINEINILDKMFVDNITKDILKQMNEPTTFRGLLVRASELLITDYVDHPNNIKNMIIKQYDRIPGLMHRILVEEIRKFYNGAGTYGNTMDVNPYEVISKLQEDSTTMLVEDNNPIQLMKLYDDVTMTGFGGRSKETIVGGSRELHESEIGIFSEAVKDSSDVGISSYLSASPTIKNVRGFVDVRDMDELKPINVLSTTSILTPYNDRDD